MAKQIGKNPGKRTRATYTSVLTSMTLGLFVLGIFGLFFLFGNRLIDYYKENIPIIVELNQDIEKNRREEIQSQIEETPFVKTQTVTFLSREKASELLANELETNYEDFGINNPFYDIIQFNILSEYLNDERLKEMSDEMLTWDGVHDVYFKKILVNNISSNMNKLFLLGALLVLIFIGITVSLIYSTVKLAMYSNRFILKNMQLVGATWEHIRFPYLTRAAINGLISGGLAVIGLLAIQGLVASQLPVPVELSWGMYGILYIGVIVLGVVVSVISTYYSVNRFLKMRLDDLY